MNIHHSVVCVAALITLAGNALGQSVNIDVNRSSSAAVPSASYAGAAAQPGTWNNVFAGTSGSVALVGLDGNATNLTLTRAGSGGGDSQSIAGASADFATLMSDFHTTTGVNAGPDFTINGLVPGYYRVYVYASLPGAAGFYLDNFSMPVYYTNYVSLRLSNVVVGSTTTSGALVANTFTQGVTHAIFDVAVGAGAPPLKVSVKTGSSNNEKCALNGLQIVKYPSNRIYVDPAKGAGAKTGESWANAYTDLQAALAIVRQSGGHITEVWVAKGNYRPTSTTDRTKAFDLVSGVKIYGGFAGSETALSQRNPADLANTTYLNGDIGVLRSIADNSYSVVRGANLSTSTLLEGVTIVGGKADGSLPAGYRDGSLVYLTDSSPTFRNCTFLNGDTHARGGAVFAKNGAPAFVGCDFSGNFAHDEGGAIYWISNGVIGAPALKVFNCNFTSNSATYLGSAIEALGGNPIIANSLFNGNQGQTTVCIQNTNNTDSMKLYNCTFSGNTGSVFGTVQGAMQDFYNCIIWNNASNLGVTPLAKTGWGSAHSVNATMTGTCIQGYSSATVPGLGNTGVDPLFVDADGPNGTLGDWDDDLRLSPSSPLIDRGLNAYIATDLCDLDADGVTSAESVPFDLDGNPRRFDVTFVADTGLGFGALVDLGAYEAQYTTPPCGTSDFNCDGDYGTDADIEAFFACLAGNCPSSPCTSSSDFNGDGDFGTDADIESFFRVLAGGAC